MALQSALSKIRKVASGNTERNSIPSRLARQDQQPVARSSAAVNNSLSIFTVEEDDLFSFDDDDLIQDDDLLSLALFKDSSNPDPSTSGSTNATSAVVLSEGNEPQSAITSSEKLTPKGFAANIHGSLCTPTNTITSTKPALSSSEKLSRFKFVKTSSSRKRTGPSDDIVKPLSPKRKVPSECVATTSHGKVSPTLLTTPTSVIMSVPGHPVLPSNIRSNFGTFQRTSEKSKSPSSISFDSPSVLSSSMASSAMSLATQRTCSGQSTPISIRALNRPLSSTISKYTPSSKVVTTPGHSNLIPYPPPILRTSSYQPPSCSLDTPPLSSRSTTSSSVGQSSIMPSSMTIARQTVNVPNPPVTGPSTNLIQHSTPHKTVQSSKYSTPLRRQSAPMVCTPTSGSNAHGIGILRTPVSVAQRKFPGPAGLLPPLVPGQNMDNIYIAPPTTPAPISTPRVSRRSVELCEPHTSGHDCDPHDFEQGPWVEMLEDLDIDDSYSSAFLNYSISQAIKQALSGKLCNGKVKHLRVLLKSILPAGKNASAVLKDPTGEMMCTIHGQVLEENQRELLPGAVLVLRQVSMFSPCPRKHYLNITPANIVKIYAPGGVVDQQPVPLSDIEKKFVEDNGSETYRKPRPPVLKPLSSPVILPSSSVNQSDSKTLSSDGQGMPFHCKQRSFAGSCAGAQFIFKSKSAQAQGKNASNATENGMSPWCKPTDVGPKTRDAQDLDRDDRNNAVSIQKPTDSSFLNNIICEDNFDDIFADFEDEN